MRPFAIAALLCTALAGLGAGACQGAPQPPAKTSPATETAPPDAALEKLTVKTARGVRVFAVEVATTAEEQQRGLMFRTELAEDEGMIFPYDPPRPARFWMKNTPIPLDMLFIRADGSIARIEAMAKPQSLDMIESGETVAAVLEIAGGEAAKQGIKAGDVVRWRGFGGAD